MDNLTARLTGMLEKARAATPGPWRYQDGGNDFAQRVHCGRGTIANTGDGRDARRDAIYLTACSPEIIAALVEVALAARQVDVAEGAVCDTLFQKLDALGKAVEG